MDPPIASMDPPSAHAHLSPLLSTSGSSISANAHARNHNNNNVIPSSFSPSDSLSPSASNSNTTSSGPGHINTADKSGNVPAKGPGKKGPLPHNVDICITCVTDKPPQLPLREELPSLGIEVVYNAQGVGAKASQREAKKLIEKFRQDEQYKDLKKRRLFAPSATRVEQKMRDRKRQEDALEIPRGISYEKYERILSSSNDQGSVGADDSTSLSGSVSTRGDSITSGEKRKQDHMPVTGHKKKRVLGEQSPRGGLPLKFSFPSHKSPTHAASPSNDDSSYGQNNHPFAVPAARSSTDSSIPAAQSQTRYRGPSKTTQNVFHSVMRGAFSDDDDSGSGGTTSYDNNESNSRSRSEEEPDNNIHPTTPTNEQRHITKTPTSPEDATSKDHSSHDVSRDPSSISTNFTKQDPNKPSPVQVVASNDPHLKKFLPGLQTVPSASSSQSTSSTSSPNRPQLSDNNSGSEEDPIVIPSPKNQPLNEAFAAFSLNPQLNDDVYEKLGPVVTNHKQEGPKRQRQDPPESPPPQSPHPQNANNKKKGNWMKTAKLAFENVAAEVYKQATGSATNSPNANSGGSPNIFEVPNKNKNNNKKTNGKHQNQPLSPSSTLSSNTANQQQQQHIQFLFPNNNPHHLNANDNNRKMENNNNNNNNNNLFHTVTLPQTPNPFPNHPHVEVHVRPDGSQTIVSSSIGSKSVTAFYEALQQPKTPVDSIQRMLRVCPGLVKVRLQQSMYQKGRSGLHTACARGFPHHRNTIGQNNNSSTNLALQLVSDIQQLKKLISVLVEANRGACTVLDGNGDLPAHLLARTLMEWEAQWYEKVYEKVQTDQDSDGRNAAAITKLYQSMSQCIEIVLHPVAAFCNINKSSQNGNAAMTLCRAPGSVGLLLPLHIASIFTASVPTLRELLEQDPSAATVPCNLGHLRTFIPDHSLPLELHDKLSTDFPKWELAQDSRKSKTIQIAGGAQLMEDYMRRSDLLFAFHPTVPRFRMETTRIERLEAKVISEANKMDQLFRETGERGHLSVAVKRIWIWMCTFQDINDHFQATYYHSVKRIVDSVPSSAIPYLANIRTPQEKALARVAAPECQALLKTRLEQYESTQASYLEQMVVQAVATASKSSKSSLVSFEDTDTSNSSAFLSLKGKGYVGVLARTLFHLHEDSMPTSFILLPYKLTKNEQGKLGIDKKSSASTAVKFAECLLKLTDPKTILYFLEQKSIQLFDHKISDDSDDERSASIKKKCEEVEGDLLALYEPGRAYLYLIDELIGLPIVPASGTSLYPIELNQPATIVKKLLPLMLTGMILMRGEKALSVLVNVLLDKTVQHVSPNWVDAAREIIAYLYSQQDSRSDNSLPGLGALIEELRAFVSNNSSVKSSGDNLDNAEWAVELSILRMVINMNDNLKSFAGLKAKRDEPGTVLWTKHRIEEETPSEKTSALNSNDMRQQDASAVLSHEDPPGALNGAVSVSSSNASTKKTGTASSASSGANPAHNSNATPLSPPPDSEPLIHASPDSNRDIEKLRMKTTQSDIGAGSPWLEPDRGHDPEDASLDEADSGLDGEELAGVRILLEAEEGPSLLDQASSTDEDGTDDPEQLLNKDKYALFPKNKEAQKSNPSDRTGNASESDTSNTDKNQKYRSRDENESGSDSYKRRPVTTTAQNLSSVSKDSIDDKDMYHDASERTDKSKEQAGRSNNRPEKQRGKRSENENEFYLGDSSQSGELGLPTSASQFGLATSKSQGNDGYLDTTMSGSSESVMLLPSKSRDSPRRRQTDKVSQGYDSESSSSSPTGTSDSHYHHRHKHASNKSLSKLGSAETDDDDDTDDSVLKFDIVQSGDHSQGSKSITTVGRSHAGRLYDESRVEVIDHSDGNSVLSAGRLFENETKRLQEYAVNHMNRPTSPPPPAPAQSSTSSFESIPAAQQSSSSISIINLTNSPETSSSQLLTPMTFGEIEPGSPIQALSTQSSTKRTPSSSSGPPSLSNKTTLSSRSNTTNSVIGRKLLPGKEIVDSRESDESLLLSPSTPSIRSSKENTSNKDFTFRDMHEHVTDQALKIDCLETTLESIKIREDKLLSRGEMLQDFLSDLVDQSENLKLESESHAKKLQRRLGNLEERLLCSEINSQHLSFSVYAMEQEAETLADEEYNEELDIIIRTQVQQQRKHQNHYEGLDEILGRAAKLDRLRAGRRGFDDESILVLDGYVSADNDWNYSNRAMGGSSSYMSTRKKYHRHPTHKQRRRGETSSRSQSQPRAHRHDTKYHSSSPYRGRSQRPHSPRSDDRPQPRRDYTMTQLVQKGSLDESSIEYEMGLAMYETILDHSNSADSKSARYPHPIRSNSLDAYEQMRSDLAVGVSVLSDGVSEAGYSSPGEFMDMSSLEGDGHDWVKMSSRQDFELPQLQRIRA